jgi:hypothetical protein
MKARVLAEPELEFRAGNRHIDPRYGMALFGPADADAPTAPRQIAVGLIGSPSAVEGIRRWLDRCRAPIDAKLAKPGQENLFLPFPGFNIEGAYRSELVFDNGLIREIPDRELRLLARSDVKAAVAEGVELYLAAARSLCDTGRCRVLICARPDELQEDEYSEPPSPSDGDDAAEPVEPAEHDHGLGGDFHDLLKARALTLPCPLQIIRRETWEGVVKDRRDRSRQRPLQDEATRAWNLHTALYYKAGGTPWRLPRNSTDLASCYVGVSFYRTSDGSELHTAVAQVFNERGDGVVVRGGAAKISRVDRRPHLNQRDARQLLADALSEYRRMHGHLPARVVLHKTSSFNDEEIEGLRCAAEEKEINFIELVWIQRRAAPRLFRSGQLPPLRGTTLRLDPQTMVVYTRGSVEFFRTYPGMYVPRPLLLRPATKTTDLARAATDVLGLSKMNWNNAQLDERDPLTLRTAYRVGAILKHVPSGEQIATRYAYYM